MQENNSGKENVSDTKGSSKKRKLTTNKCRVECKKIKDKIICSMCLKFYCGKCAGAVTITCKKCQ